MADIKDYTLFELIAEIERRIQDRERQIWKLSKCKSEKEIKDCMVEYFKGK